MRKVPAADLITAAGGRATTVAIAAGISTAALAGASKYVPTTAVPPTWARQQSAVACA